MKMVLPVDGYRSARELMEAMQGTQGDTYWLLKPGEYWHGGIHFYDGFADNAVYNPESHGLKCMTDGQVVAWRLNDAYQTAKYGTESLKFSSTFVLVKSTCIPDNNKPENALEFYTLWMQIAPLSEYGAESPTATVTASSLKVREDNPAEGWVRAGLPDGNVADAGRNYEAPLDTETTLPRGSVVEIEEEATFLLNNQPAPFMFVRVKSVPDGKESGLAAGGSGWVSGLDKYVRRGASSLPAWMQRAREHGVFNQAVSGESIEVKAGEVIGHLSYHERPEAGSQYFCHLEVFSQDPRMGDFLANKAGVTSGAAELHTLAGKKLWKYNEESAAFEVAGVGGATLFSKAERLTTESECQSKESNGKTWYEIPAESAWMSADDVEKVSQFDLEKRGFIRLEQNEEPQSLFQTPEEGWLRQTFGRLEELTRSDADDTYSSGDAESYKKLLQQMDMNQDGLIDTNELWRYLHNNQADIQYQVQRLVVKHHSEWLKDGMSALWQAALDEQEKSYPELALYNKEYVNKLVWMKDVPEIRSSDALWHMHPVVFLDALNQQSKNEIIFPLTVKPENDPGKKWSYRNWRDVNRGNAAAYGRSRDRRRLHAGRDLYTNEYESVVAICDGKILRTSPFYNGTNEVSVLHTTKDERKFIVRYGELDPSSIVVRPGDDVKQGQHLGNTGRLINDNGQPTVILDQTVVFMLHFELYTGQVAYNLSVALTNQNNPPFLRRDDLSDPIDILAEGYVSTFLKNREQNGRVEINELHTSESGKEFIKAWESLRLASYNDSEGFCTIGYGHLIDKKRCENIVLPIEFQSGIDREKAIILFEDDLIAIEGGVKRSVTVELYQYEFDALVSLLFNCGEFFLSIGKAPNLLNLLNSKEYERAAYELLDITNEGDSGLIKRRKAENNMFLNNVYDATH